MINKNTTEVFKMSCRRSLFRSLAVGVLAGCSLFVGGNVFAESPVSEIVTYAPEKNNNNVKIHFYIDGHKWMRQRRSMAFAKAIEALQNVLADRTNPLDETFRELGYNVETNTGMAYLFTPDIVEPFNLNTKNDLEDLGKKYTGQDNFTYNDFIKKILTSVPSANSVVCIITNNTVFPEKHGVCYRDKEKNITVFVLNAGRISIETGKTFSPTWKVKDWEQFLTKSMGRNANDIANVIANDYYMLSDQEKSSFKKIVGIADKHCIVLKNLFLLPAKDMWRREITFNGKPVTTSQNEIALTPKSGQNELSVSLISPVGYRYTVKWGGDEFLYTELTKEEQKTLADALKYIEQATNFAQADIENIATSKGFLSKPVKKAMKDSLVKSAGQIVSTAETYAELVKQIRELKAIIATAKHVEQEKKVTELEKRLTGATQEQIKQLQQEVAALKEEVEKTRIADTFRKYQDTVIDKINREISTHNEKDFKNTGDLKDMLRKARNAKSTAELKAIEETLAHWKPEAKPHVRDHILWTLRDQKSNFASQSRDIANYTELDDLIRRAEIADESALSNIVWKPIYSTKNLIRDIEEKIKELLPRRDEIQTESWGKLLSMRDDAAKVTANDAATVSSLRKKFAAWTPAYNVLSDATKNNLIEKCKGWIETYPASDYESEDQITTLDDIIKGINDCKKNDVKRFSKLSADAQEILDVVPVGKRGIILPVIIALIAAAGIATWIIRKFLNKKVATLEFKKTSDSEDIPPQELSLKQDFNLEILGCKVDIHAICVKGDNGEIQYQITSPNMPAWIASVGGVKKELSDTPIYETDGEFLLYETKNSMREFARIELRQISE